MSMATGRTKLVSSLKELNTRWEHVQRHWNDPVRKDFEREFLAPLEGKVRSGASAMEHMNELLMKVRRECT
jgi:hypothetical protein